MRVNASDFLPGRYFHIYNHAAQGLQLFRDSADYRICLRIIHDYLDSPDFSMISFCLMPNHYHFFIRQNGECPIYLIMNKIWFRYSRYYNKKYEGHGSIFAGKSQHKTVESDNYLLSLTAYIHLNPMNAGLVHSPGEWEWSNYREWAGLRKKYLCDHAIVDAYFSRSEDYQRQVEAIAGDKHIAKYMLD